MSNTYMHYYFQANVKVLSTLSLKVSSLYFQVYLGCGCIGYNSTTLTNISATDAAAAVKAGVCEQKCHMMYYVFVPAGFVIFFAIFCGYNTSTMLVLR